MARFFLGRCHTIQKKVLQKEYDYGRQKDEKSAQEDRLIAILYKVHQDQDSNSRQEHLEKRWFTEEADHQQDCDEYTFPLRVKPVLKPMDIQENRPKSHGLDGDIGGIVPYSRRTLSVIDFLVEEWQPDCRHEQNRNRANDYNPCMPFPYKKTTGHECHAGCSCIEQRCSYPNRSKLGYPQRVEFVIDDMPCRIADMLDEGYEPFRAPIEADIRCMQRIVCIRCNRSFVNCNHIGDKKVHDNDGRACKYR